MQLLGKIYEFSGVQGHPAEAVRLEQSIFWDDPETPDTHTSCRNTSFLGFFYDTTGPFLRFRKEGKEGGREEADLLLYIYYRLAFHETSPWFQIFVIKHLQSLILLKFDA